MRTRNTARALIAGSWEMINSQLDKLPRGEQIHALSELIRRAATRLNTLGNIVLEHDRDYPEHLQ